ncbi:diacylglycerol kinase family protein [Roseivirga sp. E12]|uniref:diacylglycerol kinase family protein n=1 Tax=Roseivirga sp. E12 TaxID=2819237 RepID=UPI001ABC9F0B|nr:diacylglycerol kinase family protein [Roseivirga sp. E12]MBO3700513.1 diacylglycerol kinase family protein [Roseivirga sp. E12]
MKPFSLKERLLSFKYALRGIRSTLWTEHNFRIHLFAALTALALGFYFEVSSNDWLWIVIAIALVFVTEMINTAIERLVDLIEPNQNPLAGKIKDIAAGAVLIAAIASATIGLIVFWPHFCL